MSENTPGNPYIASAARRRRHVFVRDLQLEAPIGVWGHEQGRKQRIQINLDLTVGESEAPVADELVHVVCYQKVIDRVRAIVSASHTKLVETLAERIAAACLEDRRVLAARIRVEKLEAVSDATSVGVEIERLQNFDT